jgi:hypothetical protein
VRGVNPSSYNLFLLLVGLVVLAGSILVYRLRREVADEACPVTDEDLLRDFERAYYAGEMDEDEFRSVTAALRAKREGTPRIAVAPATDASPESPATEAIDVDPVEPGVESEPH